MCSDSCGALRYGGPPPPRHPRERGLWLTPRIPAVIERTLEELPGRPVTHFDDLFATDAEARARAAASVRELTPA